jgi:hypothetical protein
MTKLEEFRGNADHIKAWNNFVETESGKLLMEVINEGVLAAIKRTPEPIEHVTTFFAGKTAGAAYLQNLIESLHAQEITEEERKKAQLQDVALRGLLPSQREAYLARTKK